MVTASSRDEEEEEGRGGGSTKGRAGGKTSGEEGEAGSVGGAGGSKTTFAGSVMRLTTKAEPVSRWHEVQWQQCETRGARSRR